MNDNSHITETLAPANQAAVAEAVRGANEKDEAVYPVGGGTMLDYGVKPTRPGVGLSLAKLNRVIDYPAADLTITVEAGIMIGELNRCLAAQRLRLPVDIPRPKRATIGGAVAINAAGPRRYAYGTIRDYLLGFTAVDGSGAAFSGGGRVVKNAAGYNMCRLMAGSLGTLGVMTQVTLMIRPLAEASVFFVCDVPDFVVAEKLLAGLVHSQSRPAAVEFVAGRRPENDLVLGPVLAGHVGRLYVGFEGPAAEVDWMVEQLRGQWAATGATEPMLVPTSRAEPLWRWLADFSADVQINVLPGAVTQTIAKTLEIEPDCAVLASAGDGVIRVQLGGEGRGTGGEGRGTGDEGIVSRIAQLRAVATAAGGKLVVQRNPDGLVLSTTEVWGPPGPEFRVMQAIKDRFDPKNILNPGRFIFD